MSESSLLDGKRILILDDEPDILEVLEELLDRCQTVTAPTYDQAKELLETRDFDIAILDIMGVDGYGLLEIANQKKIPAVMLTAHAFNADNLVKTIKEGAYAYIPKEEIGKTADILTDVLSAKQRGENPWIAWEERFPPSFFEKRWGAAWKEADTEFWNKFRESIRKKK